MWPRWNEHSTGVAARHEMLRVTFEAFGKEPVQRIHDNVPVRVEEIDGRAFSATQLMDSLGRDYRRPFDLEKGPLFRLSLVHESGGTSVLMLVVHHIVFDASSLAVLLHDWFVLYAAEVSGTRAALTPLATRYSDFVRWQSELLGGGLGEEMWAYWQRQLSAPLPTLDLPLDHPRPAIQAFSGETVTFRIESGIAEGLRELARQRGATPYMALLAAFQVLLYRYTGQPDIVIGSPTGGRSRQEFEGILGYFVNPVVLRGDLRDAPTFSACIDGARAMVVEALKNADYSFPLLVKRLRPQRDPSRSPLFQVEFNLVKADHVGVTMAEHGGRPSRMTLGGLEMTPIAIHQQEGQFDFSLVALDSGGPILATFKYATDLFERATVERMAGHFQRLLEGLVESPEGWISDLPLVTREEERELSRWNATARAYPTACVHELIVAQAKAAPTRVAVEMDGARLSYGELDERSRALSEHLIGLGVGADVPVGIYMERSLDMLVGLLAILRAGGAYVPLDPAYPRDRLTYMLEDSGARVLVTQQALASSLGTDGLRVVCVDGDWGPPGHNEARPATPRALAYIIYTSGSTGKPKGVAVTHRSLVNLLDSMADEPGLGAEDVLLSVTTLSFDIAGLELYLPLWKGARLVLLSRDEAGDGRALRERISTTGATVLQATPATWRLLLESGWVGTPGLKVLCGGEALPRDLADALVKRASEVWNVYGPTETTIWSSCCRVKEGEGSVSIGRPVANTALYVLDKALNHLPVGVPGELFIGGDGLARGYWQRPELTAEKFLPDPHRPQSGARMYRTGDLARRLPDGTILCLGRLDHQVKVRGFRIELGEIEAALRSYPGVTEAVAIAQDLPGGSDRRLAAYLTLGNDFQPNVTALREHLRGALPSYMVPSSFFFLDRLPLTPNGKVDRKALGVLDAGATAAAGRDQIAPRTPSEALLAEIWREALGVESVGVRDNFFDLGGHSLLAMKVLAAIETQTGHRFHPREIIFQTLEQLAAACDARTKDGPADSPGRLQRWVGALRALARPGAQNPEA